MELPSLESWRFNQRSHTVHITTSEELGKQPFQHCYLYTCCWDASWVHVFGVCCSTLSTPNCQLCKSMLGWSLSEWIHLLWMYQTPSRGYGTVPTALREWLPRLDVGPGRGFLQVHVSKRFHPFFENRLGQRSMRLGYTSPIICRLWIPHRLPLCWCVGSRYMQLPPSSVCNVAKCSLPNRFLLNT